MWFHKHNLQLLRACLGSSLAARVSMVPVNSSVIKALWFFLIHTKIYSITGDLQALVIGRNINLPIHFKKLQFPKLSFSDSIGSLSFCTAAFISFMSIWAKKSSSCHPACKYQCEEEEEEEFQSKNHTDPGLVWTYYAFPYFLSYCDSGGHYTWPEFHIMRWLCNPCGPKPRLLIVFLVFR